MNNPPSAWIEGPATSYSCGLWEAADYWWCLNTNIDPQIFIMDDVLPCIKKLLDNDLLNCYKVGMILVVLANADRCSDLELC